MSDDFIRRTLDDLQARGLLRRLTAVGSCAGPTIDLGGRRVLSFASNNYLGLAADPRVTEAARRALERWGWGAGSSRAVAGHTDAHAALEADLAAFKHAEAALVFPSGYQANLGLLTALAGRGDLVLMDRANHASLYDGVRLSGADLDRYAHADTAAAAGLLEKHRGRPGRRLLVTDTVFSMDGDLAPLAALAALAEREGAMLLVDEAHALGVLGPTGAGLAEAAGVGIGPSSHDHEVAGMPLTGEDARDLTFAARGGTITASVGTLSKALGGVGGFVAASRDVCDLLVNRARSFLYTTALPAAACEAARAALAIVRTEPERRVRLLELSRQLRAMLIERGFDLTTPSTGGMPTPPLRGHEPGAEGTIGPTPIIPVIVGEPERALAMAGRLLERGIFCPAIRPPTVPPGTSRLRISLTCEHTDEDLARLAAALVAARDGV